MAGVSPEAPDHSRLVSIWMDQTYVYVMGFGGDSLQEAGGRRRALGVEPMSSALNAFQRRDGLVRYVAPAATRVKQPRAIRLRRTLRFMSRRGVSCGRRPSRAPSKFSNFPGHRIFFTPQPRPNDPHPACTLDFVVLNPKGPIGVEEQHLILIAAATLASYLQRISGTAH